MMERYTVEYPVEYASASDGKICLVALVFIILAIVIWRQR